jgi:hypothetical protein
MEVWALLFHYIYCYKNDNERGTQLDKPDHKMSYTEVHSSEINRNYGVPKANTLP